MPSFIEKSLNPPTGNTLSLSTETAGSLGPHIVSIDEPSDIARAALLQANADIDESLLFLRTLSLYYRRRIKSKFSKRTSDEDGDIYDYDPDVDEPTQEGRPNHETRQSGTLNVHLVEKALINAIIANQKPFRD